METIDNNMIKEIRLWGNIYHHLTSIELLVENKVWVLSIFIPTRIELHLFPRHQDGDWVPSGQNVQIVIPTIWLVVGMETTHGDHVEQWACALGVARRPFCWYVIYEAGRASTNGYDFWAVDILNFGGASSCLLHGRKRPYCQCPVYKGVRMCRIMGRFVNADWFMKTVGWFVVSMVSKLLNPIFVCRSPPTSSFLADLCFWWLSQRAKWRTDFVLEKCPLAFQHNLLTFPEW